MTTPIPPEPKDDALPPLRHLEVAAAAARALSASLDLGVMDRLARLLVPTIADICAIDLIERDGTSRRVAAVHADPAGEETVRELGKYLPSLATHPIVVAALRSGTPVIAADVDIDALLEHVHGEEEASLIRHLDIRSGMAVPMRGQTGPVGVLTLAQSISGRRFGEEDLALAQDIARQAALSAENAMLFRNLREAHERYRTVVDGVEAIVWEARADPFRHVFVSERAAAITGYEAARWCEEGFWASIVHPDDRSWVVDRFERAAKRGEDDDLTYRIIAEDGRIIWLHDRLFASDDDEAGALLLGISVDVTERRNAEIRLRAQLETTRIFAEAESPAEIPARILHALLITLDWGCGSLWEASGTALRCIEFDQAPGVHVPAFEAATWRSTFERGTGLPGRVLASGQPAWIPDVTKDTNFPRAPAARESGLRGAFAFPIVAEGRVQGVLEFFSRQVYAPDEGLIHLVGTIGVQMGQFIRRRRVEEDLRASRARLRAIIDTELDAAITMDRSGIVTDVNRAAEAMFGYTVEQMIGHDVADLVIPERMRERHREGLRRYLHSGATVMIGTRAEVLARRADGSEFPAELSVGVHYESGEPIFTGFVRDLTALRESDRRREALHEITRALAESHTLAEGAHRIIETVCATFDWDIGLMWELDRSIDRMRYVTSWRRDPRSGEAFIAASERTVKERGVGLIGHVWETKEAIWLADVSNEPAFVRAQAAAREGYRGVIAIPVIWAGEVVGALDFYSHEIREPDEDLQKMMAGIGVQIGGSIERVQRARESALQRTLLQAQSEATIDGMLVVSPEGRTLLRNQRFLELFGLSDDSTQTGHDARILDAALEMFADPEATRASMMSVISHPEVVDRTEIEMKDGRTFDRYTAPLVDEQGTFHGRLWSFRDITSTKRTERALYEVNLRTTFLADVSRALVGSLDPNELLQNLVRMAVPAIADWCAVDLLRRDGSLDRVAAHPAHGKIVPPPEDDRRGPSHVVRTGRSELEPELMDPRDAQARKQSSICVPLIAGGTPLGALTFVTRAPERRYQPADLWLAEDVARRVAVALDNARLYEASTKVAATLQQSLLPPDLPAIPGMQIAARFRPAGAGLEVGGDFYDLFSTARGDWAVVVGDVCGKGAEAAAVTALARYTIRAAAMETRRPRPILRRLNEALLRQRADDRFCTVAYARIRTGPGGGFRLTTSSAGHPLPFLVRADATVEQAAASGMLLGSFPDVQLTEKAFDMAPGDTIVLFTDGVSEAGRDDEMLGEDGIESILSSVAGASAEDVATALERAALARLNGVQHDDMAIVVLRAVPEGGSVEPNAGRG